MRFNKFRKLSINDNQLKYVQKSQEQEVSESVGESLQEQSRDMFYISNEQRINKWKKFIIKIYITKILKMQSKYL